MPTNDYARIAKAISFIESHLLEQPGLDEVAEEIGLSPFHFQRLFSRWAGISPKRLTQYLTLRYAQRRLDERDTVLGATYDSGLSSPSRLHELFVHLVAATPAEYRDGGEGLTIRFGVVESPFGLCFLASTERGIVRLSFIDDPADPTPFGMLTKEVPHTNRCTIYGALIE